MLHILAQTVTPGQVITWILLGVLALVGLFIFFVMLGVLKLYVQALFSDAKVAMLDLIMMRLRKVPPEVVSSTASPPRRPASTSPPTSWKPTTSPAAMSAAWSRP